MRCKLVQNSICLISLGTIFLSLSVLKAEEKEPVDKGPLTDEAREFADKFAPKGAMADGSPLIPAEDALEQFTLRDGVALELVASEPEIAQPLYMTWDFRGRLWVVQYLQYPFPAGLKIVRYDQYLRAVFDKVPAPPPKGPKGADRITVLEDTDGDGYYDSSKDVLTGLNLATAVLPGRDGFWVLQPPYLLRYPDTDRDDKPDGDPEVHLSGFGLEDTHSLANSLRWGPDGWIYGANGSTTTASISSGASKNVSWKGQCIWRYHPETQIFEIFAEGGGNTFSLDIDSAGRVFSGTNGGSTRGMHYEQGSYGSKNWGKHGPLTNPYAFGYFSHMGHQGDNRRFAQAFLIYEGGQFGGMFDGKIIAPNALHNTVWVSALNAGQSTFHTADEEPLMQTADRWFRPVDAKVGPDGAIYLADWTDSRLSHVSPIDDWHKASGRIYRIRPADGWKPGGPIDVSSIETEGLLGLLDHPNKRIRRQAVLQMGWNADPAADEKLSALALEGTANAGLESVWVLHLTGKLDPIAPDLLKSSNHLIRRATVRLLGDRRWMPSDTPPSASDETISSALVDLAKRESHPEVRVQIAATARRMEPDTGVRILWELAKSDSGSDTRMNLMIWWGLEQFASGETAALTERLNRPGPRSEFFKFAQKTGITSRLSRRFASAGGDGFQACLTLLENAPDKDTKGAVLDGILEAFQGASLPELPDKLTKEIRAASESTGSALAVGIRSGDEKATAEAIRSLGDSATPMRERLAITEALGDARVQAAIKPLLNTLGPPRQYALKRAAMRALGNFDSADIAKTILSRWQNSLPDEHGLRETAQRVLVGRKDWAVALLKEVEAWRIPPDAILPDVLQSAALYKDAEIDQLIARSWPNFKPLSSEFKLAKMKDLKEILTAEGAPAGDPVKGLAVYNQKCAQCHRLFGKGENVAPDLTGYERGNLDFWLPAIIDPNLEIREGFVTHIAETNDGRTLVGFVAERGPDYIKLRDPAGNLSSIVSKDLKNLTASPISLMPEGILEGLDEQSLRNLFAYLMSKE